MSKKTDTVFPITRHQNKMTLLSKIIISLQPEYFNQTGV